MLRKVHIRLTLLCTGITMLIISIMSGSYLFISEKNLKETYFSSFQNDMDTLLANLVSQSVITHKWLSQMEGNGKYIIDIRDNGVSFLWGNRSANNQPARRSALEAGWAHAGDSLSPSPAASPYFASHQEFSFSSTGQRTADYYGSTAVFNRKNGVLSILILKPLEPLTAQIRSQRLIFAALIAAASIVLGLFSWFFTGRLLSPIEQSRLSQIRFVAAASHELRTPLSVILSAASACQKAPAADQDKFFTIIQEEGKSMSHLITDLLTLAGADDHSFSIRRESCEMDTLLLNTYEAFEPLAREKGYPFSISLPDKIIAPVSCDSDRIRQVLSILIHNALCYTPPGSSIRLSLGEADGKINLSVADDGPGIPDSAKPHIFERFYRADSSYSDSGHFGLGLSIADEIMRAHGGTVTVSDTPGGGATFTLTLPRG